MIQRPGERLPPITPRLALRVALLGAVALGLFAIVFFRLWYLQVLTGDQYLAEARENRVREMRIQAPRGEIVDRSGDVIVTNKQATVVSLDPSELPEAERDNAAEWGKAAGEREARPKGKKGPKVPYPEIPTPGLAARYERLGQVLGLSAESIHRRVIRSLAIVPYSNVVLKVDVPRSKLNYLSERHQEFPGVEVSQRYLRDYPEEQLAAQLLGTVGEISPDQLKQERYREVDQGQIIGQEGLEKTYDRYLRGKPGVQRVVVDAFGRRKPNDRLRDTPPKAGRRLRLSLDLGLQKTGQEALRSIGGGRPGAFVALDPRNGQVLAMGSYPSFDPNRLTRPITEEQYERLYGENAGAPRFNRAVSGSYPTGSTFKPITAMALLESGMIDPSFTVADGGCITFGAQEFCNAGKQAYGSVDLVRSLVVSSDVYYYTLGARANTEEEPIQTWARKLGLDEPTGIDLPGEFDGTVPDREWRAERAKLETECRKEKDVRSCGISDGRPWSIGDSVQLAIGQGDLQASPLQMAVAYSAIANGGKVVTPHLGLEVQDGSGVPVQRIETDPARKLDLDESSLAAVRQGLLGAANADGGTSTAIFDDFPERYRVFGKTGTAQRGAGQDNLDQSWYVGFVPDAKRPIVVAATVEKGGFGAERAAPITCRVLAGWFDVKSQCSGGGATD